MSLIVHRADRPEALARRLAELLAPAPANPFATDQVAVHSRGLSRWLSQQLAQHNGICSAVDFPRPEVLIARLAAQALGEELVSSWQPEELTWALLAELPARLPDPVFSPVRAYLDADGPTEHSLRLATLCQRLAGVFSRYAVYRPELVRSWQHPHPDEPWEAPLWRALEARLGRTHLTALEARVAGAPALQRPERIALFSVSTLPPLLLRIAGQLAAEQDLHVFVLHPSPAAWQAPPAHPLMRSMGTLVQDLRDALERCAHVQHALLDTPELPRDSTLHALQADLRDDQVRPLANPDDSVQVHTCASPLRQVQVLRDVLLGLLDDPALQPRDIVVMCPDIETFAPLITAVFSDGSSRWGNASNHPAGFPALPFRLADRGPRAENDAANALVTLLELADSRLEAPAVLELLSLQPVRERFGVPADGLTRVRELLVAAGARWGRDAAHRAAVGQPADDRYTWRYAIDRLLLAQALDEPGSSTALGHAPPDGVQGKDDRQLVGGLVDFTETLLSTLQTLTAPRPAADWFAALAQAVDGLLADGGERAWQKRQIRTTLDDLAQHAQAAGVTEPIDRRTLRELVAGRFTTRQPGAGFLAGSITVCQLVPLRSVPFQVVCLLGMDDGAFPRIEARPGYDRMALDPRPGDRDARRDDRSLFLEAVLSARRSLVVTCSGKDVRTGRDRPLSIPVVELLETVQAMGADPRIDHPLQPWSPQVFTERGGHDHRMAQAAQAWREGRAQPQPVPARFSEPLPPLDAPLTELSLAELNRFWRHPRSYLVRHRLGLSLWEDTTELTGQAPVELDNLALWGLDDTLLRWGQRGADLSPTGEVALRMLRGATLPQGTPGQVELLVALERVQGLLCAVQGWQGPAVEPVEIQLDLGLQVWGRVGQLTPTGRLVLQAGRVHPRHQLVAWIEHLALHAQGWQGPTRIVGPPGGFRFDPVDAEQARAHLRALCEAVPTGLVDPPAFWADASHDAHAATRADKHPGFASLTQWHRRKDREKLVDAWFGPSDSPFFQDDPADGIGPHAWAATVWEPALAHRHKEVLP